MNDRIIIATLLTGLGLGLSTGCERGANEPVTLVTPVTPTTPATPEQAEQPGKSEHAAAGAATIETVQVSSNIYMLLGRGGNIGVSVGDDGILIIDDKFAPLANDIRNALSALHKGPLVYVLNTHHHGDHVGGNEVFGKDATIIAHDNVRKRLRGDDKPADALPVITFADSLSVHFNGETMRVVHFPHAHTDSDSVIFFENANVVHMGDLFFNGRFPFVDIGGGGDPVQLAEHVRHILGQTKADTKFIPGHGNLGTRAQLETYLTMLDETIASVRQQIAENKSLPQIKKRGVPERWSSWGAGFVTSDKWLEILHQALSAKVP